MNFYPFHIGDYATATGHLSWVEDIAYRRLLDLYYVTESPLVPDVKALCRLLRAHEPAQQEAVKTMLEEFFERTDAGWRHKRCEEEIAAVITKRNRAVDAVRRRWGPEAGGATDLPVRAAGNTGDGALVNGRNTAGIQPVDGSNTTEVQPMIGGNTPNPITNPNPTPNPNPSTTPNPTPNPIPSPPAAANQAGPPVAANQMGPPPAAPDETTDTNVSAHANPPANPAAADAAPTRDQLAGAACRRMREAGIHSVNPSSADLLALIDAGITPRQFADFAREIATLKPGRPMQYVVATIKNRMKEGALLPPGAPSAVARPVAAPQLSPYAGDAPVYNGYRPAARDPDRPSAHGPAVERI